MSMIRILMQYFLGRKSASNTLDNPINYEQVVHLDAEELAEEGIKSAYEKLLTQLRHYTTTPHQLIEEVDHVAVSYVVVSDGQHYKIWDASSHEDSWIMATVAFFSIVNANLGHSSYKFYALEAGNELGGIFLTEEQYSLARQSIKTPFDWPYLPVMEPPNYGYPC